MASDRQGWTWGALAALAVTLPAMAQPADPDGPLPTARYERPPEGVDPSILNRPPPAQQPTLPTPSANGPARPVAAPSFSLPDVPTVRRRGPRAPASLETTTVAPQERPWSRPSVGAQAAPADAYAPAPRVASAPPQAAAPAPTVAPAGPKVELQIGAFAERANAERAARAARMAGPTRIQPTTVGGVTYHRVIVGPGAEASMRATLGRLGFPEARRVRGS